MPLPSPTAKALKIQLCSWSENNSKIPKPIIHKPNINLLSIDNLYSYINVISNSISHGKDDVIILQSVSIDHAESLWGLQRSQNKGVAYDK